MFFFVSPFHAVTCAQVAPSGVILLATVSLCGLACQHPPPSSRLVRAWVGPAGLVGDGQVGEGHHKKLCQSVAMSNAWRRGGGTAGRDSFMAGVVPAGMYPLTTSIHVAPTSRASRGYVQTVPQLMVLPPAATPGYALRACILVVQAGCTALLQELCSLHQSCIGKLNFFIKQTFNQPCPLHLELRSPGPCAGCTLCRQQLSNVVHTPVVNG